jgi:hypothetical protein
MQLLPRELGRLIRLRRNTLPVSRHRDWKGDDLRSPNAILIHQPNPPISSDAKYRDQEDLAIRCTVYTNGSNTMSKSKNNP